MRSSRSIVAVTVASALVAGATVAPTIRLYLPTFNTPHTGLEKGIAALRPRVAPAAAVVAAAPEPFR